MDTPCKIWPKGKKSKGKYGVLYQKVNGKWVQFMAHRWYWEQAHGPIPNGMCVLHKCDTPSCYNVDHLFLGTQADNMADMDAKGRRYTGNHKGELSSNHIFNSEQVKQIRDLFASGHKISAIQKQFGCKSYQGIWCIVHRKTWKHI